MSEENRTHTKLNLWSLERLAGASASEPYDSAEVPATRKRVDLKRYSFPGYPTVEEYVQSHCAEGSETLYLALRVTGSQEVLSESLWWF